MSQLIEAYTSMLTASGLTVKEDGSVFKKDERYFIKGKPLMLPLPAVLNRSDVGDKLIFHPLSEAAAKGESDVLEDLRGRFMLELNKATAKLIAFFLQLGLGTTKIKLDPEQMKVMKVVKDVSEKEARDILSVITNTTRGEGKRTPLLRLYLSRRPQTVGKTKYYRTGIVTFPLYEAAKEELKKDKGFELLGVKINKKGLESLCRLMEFIYPGIDQDPEVYNQGSTSQIAPFADAMVRTVGGLYSIFNEKVDLYKTVSEVDALRLPTSWVDVADTMDDMFGEIQAIPLQPNADGKARVSDMQTADLAVRPQAHRPEPAPSATPQVQVTPAPSMAYGTTHQPAAAPAPQQGAEPMYIRDAHGVRRNPNYMRPAMVGAVPGQAGAFDPYGSHVLLPASTSVIPPQPAYNPYNAPFGAPQQQPMGYQYGGTLPGL